MQYIKQLGKRVITVVVLWNVVAVCLIATLLISGLIIGLVMSSQTETASTYNYVHGTGTNELLSINISGVIVGTDDTAGTLFSSLSGQTAGYTIKDQLYAAAEDDLIKGVILEIDSPGGTIYGAHAIADGVAHYRVKTKKPVYAHISGMGASGAYWGAVAADKVYADYGSDIGSIGVIMGPFAYYNTPLSQDGGILGGGVLTQNGIETVTLTAGKSKDVGNPYRRLTVEEIAVLQKQVNNEYDGFVKYVSDRRSIPEATIRGQIGAMAYDPKTALELKLTDGTLNRQAAYDKLAEAAKVKDDYSVIQEQPPVGLVATLLSAVSPKPQPQTKPVDLCMLSRSSLAYHGDVSTWCEK